MSAIATTKVLCWFVSYKTEKENNIQSSGVFSKSAVKHFHNFQIKNIIKIICLHNKADNCIATWDTFCVCFVSVSNFRSLSFIPVLTKEKQTKMCSGYCIKPGMHPSHLLHCAVASLFCISRVVFFQCRTLSKKLQQT